MFSGPAGGQVSRRVGRQAGGRASERACRKSGRASGRACYCIVGVPCDAATYHCTAGVLLFLRIFHTSNPGKVNMQSTGSQERPDKKVQVGSRSHPLCSCFIFISMHVALMLSLLVSGKLNLLKKGVDFRDVLLQCVYLSDGGPISSNDSISCNKFNSPA